MEIFKILIALSLISGVVGQGITGYPFNCNRPSQSDSCTPGTCDPATGTCTCGAGNNAVHEFCVVSADSTTSCTGDCGTGTCYTDGSGNDQCYCTHEFMGSDCKTPRGSVTCTPSDITISYTTLSTFSGKMFAQGHEATPACNLAATTGNTYSATFGNTACGVTSTTTGTVTEYTVKIDVEESTMTVHAYDAVFTIKCSIDSSLPVSSSIGTIDASEANKDTGTGENTYNPLITKMLDDSDAEITGTVNLGDKIKFAITMETNAAFSTILAHTCYIGYETPNPDGTFTNDNVHVVDALGCPLVTAKPLYAGAHEALTSPTGVAMPYYAFIFDASRAGGATVGPLYFTCQVTLCASTSTDCAAPTCGLDVEAGLGRRRRRGANDEETTVSRFISVGISKNVTTVEEQIREKEIGSGSGSTDVCLKNPVLQSVISLLGILCLGLLLALIIVSALFCRRRRSHGKQYDDGRSTTSSTKSLDMHIPRPRV